MPSIARVAEGVDPERILVLTFGRRGATALRHRIGARIAGLPDLRQELDHASDAGLVNLPGGWDRPKLLDVLLVDDRRLGGGHAQRA